MHCWLLSSSLFCSLVCPAPLSIQIINLFISAFCMLLPFIPLQTASDPNKLICIWTFALHVCYWICDMHIVTQRLRGSFLVLHCCTGNFSALGGVRKKSSSCLFNHDIQCGRQHYSTRLSATLLHAALFLTFLQMKYSLRKFPTWNIHGECCWGAAFSRKLLAAFWSN